MGVTQKQVKDFIAVIAPIAQEKAKEDRPFRRDPGVGTAAVFFLGGNAVFLPARF